MKMPFGKHQGIEISQVDRSYLRWVLANCTKIKQDLKTAIQEELDGSGLTKDTEITRLKTKIKTLEEQQQKQQRFEKEAFMKGVAAANVKAAKMVSERIITWRRDVAKKYHPDAGGSNEIMSVINNAYDQLIKMLN